MKSNRIFKNFLKKRFEYPAIAALFITFSAGIVFLILINYFPMLDLSPTPWREVITKKSFWIAMLSCYPFAYIEILFHTPSNNEEDANEENDEDKNAKQFQQ